MLQRTFSTVVKLGETYSKPLQYLHAFGAVGMTTSVVTALAAQQIPGDPKETTAEKTKLRGQLMHVHESFGILMLGALVPRVGVRLANQLSNRIPGPMPGTIVEQYAGKLSHFLLYGILIFMPISGFAFGYASGWGVPFFMWHIPGDTKENAQRETNKKIEGFFYENHHRVGKVLEYLLPLHIAASFYHYFRGHQIVARMWPWAKPITDKNL